MKFLFFLLFFVSIPNLVIAEKCKIVHPKPGEIIDIKSSIMIGTRISLPANLLSKPIASSDARENGLFNISSVVGTNQVYVKPTSDQPNGEKTMVFAYLDDGNVYDIRVTRAEKSNPCVIITNEDQMYTNEISSGINNFVKKKSLTENISSMNRQEIVKIKADSEKKIKIAVEAALSKYRYHIYTRYNWDEGKEFVGENTVSDVYDDGRFTYIRLANSNRGVLSVETNIGGETAIAPTKYNDAYNMYRIVGIYPSFILRVDNVRITINRADNASFGGS